MPKAPAGQCSVISFESQLLSHTRTPDEWKAFRAQRQAAPSTKKVYAQSTQDQLKITRNSWNKFHIEMYCCDPQLALENIREPADITPWLCYTSVHTKCQSTVISSFKFLQMLFSEATGNSLKQSINNEVNAYIKRDMTAERNLFVGEKEKPVVSAICFIRLIEGLWKWSDYQPSRAVSQYLFNMKIMAYTASRPGALVGTKSYQGEAILYKDAKLALVKYKPGKHVFTLELRIERAKNKHLKHEPITFLLHEIRDKPIICPIFDFITIAFLDQAFMDVKSPEELYQLRVPDGLDTLHIPFRAGVLDMPICRAANGETLTYSLLDYAVKQSGRGAGFRQSPSCYWLRRGAANAIGETATSSELRLIMGHNTDAVFQKHYLNRKIQCDTQSAFLGTDPAANTFEILKRIERNPEAPQKLDPILRSKLWKNPALEELINKKEEIKREIEKQGTSRKCRDDPGFVAADNAVEALKFHLRRTAFAEERSEFFRDASSKEIRQQLNPGDKNPSQHLKAPHIYGSDQHEMLVEAILNSSRAEHLRPEVIRDLVQFCLSDPAAKRCNPTDNLVAPAANPVVSINPVTTTSVFEEIPVDDVIKLKHLEPLICPFCLHSKIFSTLSNLRRHVRKIHLKIDSIISGRQIPCPSSICRGLYDCIDHLKNHILLEHGISL